MLREDPKDFQDAVNAAHKYESIPASSTAFALTTPPNLEAQVAALAQNMAALQAGLINQTSALNNHYSITPTPQVAIHHTQQPQTATQITPATNPTNMLLAELNRVKQELQTLQAQRNHQGRTYNQGQYNKQRENSNRRPNTFQSRTADGQAYCTYHQVFGHSTEACRAVQRSGQTPRVYSAQNVHRVEGLTCQWCGRPGHATPECYALKRQMQDPQKQNTNQNQGN